MSTSARPLDDWSSRWSSLGRSAGIAPEEKLLLALSGGADSVLLLHWLASARPGVAVRAAHVDHGLRGAESDADARFAAELAKSLGVPFVLLRSRRGRAARATSATGCSSRRRSPPATARS